MKVLLSQRDSGFPISVLVITCLASLEFAKVINGLYSVTITGCIGTIVVVSTISVTLASMAFATLHQVHESHRSFLTPLPIPEWHWHVAEIVSILAVPTIGLTPSLIVACWLPGVSAVALLLPLVTLLALAVINHWFYRRCSRQALVLALVVAVIWLLALFALAHQLGMHL